MAVTLEQVKVADLKSGDIGDIIDATHYKYRSTPCWAEVDHVAEYGPTNPGYFAVWMKDPANNTTFAMWGGRPFSPYDLFTVQRVDDA